MKTRTTLLIALLLTTAIHGFAQSGETFSETRTSMAYHYIQVKGEMNVKVVQENLPGVTVEGSRFQLANTITMLRNDTLLVYQTNTRKGEAKPTVIISVENISLLEVSGKSKVDCSGLINADYLTIRAYDGAQIKLDVRAIKVDSKATGCSHIDLSGIVATNSQNIEGCGIIDTQLLEVMDHENAPSFCTGC